VKGRIEERTLHSAALEGNPLGDPADRPLFVYVPEGYDGSTDRFPTVYFLHGFLGTGRGWLASSAFSPSVPERIDALFSRGTPKALCVFIDGFSAIGGSQWDDSPAIGRYRGYVVEDVVRYVDANFRTLPEPHARALVGKSSGGYGTLVIGRHHPDVFGQLACHSGDAYFEYCFLPDFPKAAGALLKAGGAKAWLDDFRTRARETKMRGDDFPVLNVLGMSAAFSPDPSAPLGLKLPFEPETAKVIDAVFSLWLERDPVRFIPADPAPFVRLSNVFIDCGTRDEFNLRWGTRLVARALEQAGARVHHEEFEDGHSGTSYRYERSLAYLLPRMGVRRPS
jgi:S-formylglutathione hydrolase FrmB